MVRPARAWAQFYGVSARGAKAFPSAAHRVTMHGVPHVTIRAASEADCDDLGLITVSASFSAFIGAIPERLLDLSWSPAQSAATWRRDLAGLLQRGDAFLVAEEDGHAIGFAWARPRTDEPPHGGEVAGLYVLPTCQGRGIGRRLLRAVVERLMLAGVTTLRIGCVRENPSCGFYRHLGGRELGRRPVTVDAFDTEELVFGWDDLSPLVAGGGVHGDGA